MLSVGCPTCGKLLQIPEAYAGQRGRCNGCKNEIQVPSLPNSSSAPASPATERTLDSEVPSYAGFWRRVAAYLIDAGVLSVPNAICAVVVVTPLTGYLIERIQGEVLPQYQALLLALVAYVLPSAAMLLLAWPYFAAFESSHLQGTLGKMVVGLRVTNVRGQRASLIRATWRYGAKLASFATAIGFLLAAFTKRKQAFHDLVAGTLVVRNNSSQQKPLWLRGTIGSLALIAPLAVGSYAFVSSDNPYVARAKALRLDQVNVGSALGAEIMTKVYSQDDGVATLSNAFKQINGTTLGDAFALLAKGPVQWDTAELPISDEYHQTHVVVQVGFKNQDSHPVMAQFLCEKQGDAILLRSAKVGYEEIDVDDFYKIIYEVVGESFSADLAQLAKATSHGLQPERGYRLNKMIYAALTPAKFDAIAKQAKANPDAAAEIWYAATQSGDAVAIDVDTVVRLTILLPDDHRPEICQISLPAPPPTVESFGGFGQSTRQSPGELVYTLKSWVKDSATPEPVE